MARTDRALVLPKLDVRAAGAHPGHGADVVLVPVRDEHRLNLVLVLRDERHVGKHLLNAQFVVAAGRRGQKGSVGPGGDMPVRVLQPHPGSHFTGSTT